ncbi:MAG: cell division protein FtsA [Candidatus Promineifilaceae bacterium]|jgi:cell division protein FtsA
MEQILFGLDVGTTKVCAIVGALRDDELQIIGVGVEPSRGMRKGMVVDVAEASIAVAAAIEKAEQSSGYELSDALVSMAGEHISCTNSRGLAPINQDNNGIVVADIERALEAAQAIPVPYNREIVHMIPREYAVDEHKGVKNPLGMHGYRLEVESHIVTAAIPALRNLGKCASNVGINVEEYVFNVLASGEAVLEPNEREMGVIVADIGGGTTDIALYRQGVVWYTKVIPIGGYQITNDIAIGLRAPYEVAETVKIKYGDCRPTQIDPNIVFPVEPFGGEKIQVGRQDLAYVIEARVEEIFKLVLRAIEQSGYDGLLPAGLVLTGGTAQLRGITDVAERVLNVPCRVANPRNLLGLVDNLHNPAYATSVGLLQWARNDGQNYRPHVPQRRQFGRRVHDILRAFLPG